MTIPPVSNSGCCSTRGSAEVGPETCCGGRAITPMELTAALGYEPHELKSLPEGANLGLSCGNPNALASLRPGEVVLDLGAGAGLDCFIAGPRVGPSGRVIGVDMTSDMVLRARRNGATYRERSGLDNVEFRLGEIEHLPVPDSSVDVVISNCVLNLSPDKPQVWREIARVLKPGGRVAISDVALLAPLPAEIRENVEALVGCIAGAVMIRQTEQMAADVGLIDILSRPRPAFVEAMVNQDDPLFRSTSNELVASVEFTASKPGIPVPRRGGPHLPAGDSPRFRSSV